MNSDVLWSLAFIAIGIWLIADGVVYWNDEDVKRLSAFGAKYLRVIGGALLIIVGILYLLDTLEILHG